MIVGIDASRAFINHRTGIEEYSYQLIAHLRSIFPDTVRVILYTRANQKVDLDLPSSWEVRPLHAPILWTQVRLSAEMLFHPPDILFVPAHTVPFIHPKSTIVTVHGLEYEFFGSGYSWWERLYMRLSIRFSTWVAKKIIAVSENTKQDLVRFYGIPSEKIEVVYEGFDQKINTFLASSRFSESNGTPYFLYIGRLEKRKNICGIIEAFEMFKEKNNFPYRLVLAGKPGYGYSAIKKKIEVSSQRIWIQELGYVSAEQKYTLLKQATAFIFPSYYEGFGLPILEAQAAGIPVVTSNVSSLPEVAGNGAILVDPKESKNIALAMAQIVSDHFLRDDILKKAAIHLEKFSWERCARDIARVIFETQS